MNEAEVVAEVEPEGGLSLRTITPDLPPQVLGKLAAFIEIKSEGGREKLITALRRLQTLWADEKWSLELRAVALLLSDLLDQGWEVFAGDTTIQMQPPGLRRDGESLQQSKDRLRRALNTGRDRQLKEAGVRDFIERMQRPAPRGGRKTSIADVVEDGYSLASALQAFTGLSDVEAGQQLKAVVDPYVQVCDDQSKCEFTGLRVLDIWRYFRHTWALEYRSMPGRQMPILIRNAARPNHPVIGIAMLASPVVRMRVRDNWIGWNTEPFLKRLSDEELDPAIALRTLSNRIEKSINEIRWDDLVSADELAFPTERTLLRLEQRAAGAAIARLRELEERYSKAAEANETVRSVKGVGKSKTEITDWVSASADPLFIKKRSETLRLLLEAKRFFQSLDWNSGGRTLIRHVLESEAGGRAISTALVEVRKAGLSSQVADVSICGAAGAYGPLLGGKLVALLMASKEVRDGYRARYAEQVSVISSQMAGRAVYRPAELKILTTTSLYGTGSSQYNRLSLRKSNFPGLAHDVAWKELEKTAGFGTVHLSPTTVRVLREVSEGKHGARRVNHRFGEGASPRLRQIREAVEALGINAETVLHHATPRILYGCELHPGATRELLGINPATEDSGPSCATIAACWRERWLAGRIRQPNVLDTVAQRSAHELAEFFFQKTRADETVEQQDLFDRVDSTSELKEAAAAD